MSRRVAIGGLGAVAVMAAAIGCADSAVTAERRRVDAALGQTVVAARLAEIRAAADLELDPVLPGAPEDGLQASGRLTRLRRAVARLHGQLEWDTRGRVETRLRDEQSRLERRLGAVEAHMAALQDDLAKMDPVGPGEGAQLEARHWVLAATVAVARTGEARTLAGEFGSAGSLTPKAVRTLAGKLRAVGRVIGDAYGSLDGELGHGVVQDVIGLADDLEWDILQAGLAMPEHQEKPVPFRTLDSLQAKCRRVVQRCDTLRPKLRNLPEQQTRRLIAAAIAVEGGWLHAAAVDRATVVQLLDRLHALYHERGERPRVRRVEALAAGLPPGVLSGAACAELADALAELERPW